MANSTPFRRPSTDKQRPRLLFAAALVWFPGLALASEPIFSPADILNWETRAFEGETQYKSVEIDGRHAVHASCDNSASGLYLKKTIDLERTPILEWSWRVDKTFTGIDETTRAGDDYPARVYVVKDGGLLRWRTRAINYVWASEKPEGADWPNAYASQARMLAVRSGPPAETGQWFSQRRNVREDFQRLHDRAVDSIDAIAIMTDCDDTESTIEAWYGEIRFVPE
ncbi:MULTISPECIES: DUF3047 domain-containing protein [unclassified Thioalkalivibrio]|uniref:DUF3047 domain-containing protein n=1 Tax=unclassified Thioalkalivibrio TaxID=2621013 RepID=UPI00037D8112|nr:MULTISPECIES: DUF3047 domain-containing protein [unclassified Thioalkalivibrio]